MFSKPLLTATLSFIHSFRLGGKRETLSESSWNSCGFMIDFYSFYSSMIFCDNYHVGIDHMLRFGIN